MPFAGTASLIMYVLLCAGMYDVLVCVRFSLLEREGHRTVIYETWKVMLCRDQSQSK